MIGDSDFAPIDQELVTLELLFSGATCEEGEMEAVRSRIRSRLLSIYDSMRGFHSLQREREFLSVLRDAILSVSTDEQLKTYEYVYQEVRSAVVAGNGLGTVRPITLRARLIQMGWIDTSRRNTVPPAKGGGDGSANR